MSSLDYNMEILKPVGPQAGSSTPAEGLTPPVGAAAPGLTAGGNQPRPAHRAGPALGEHVCV